MALVDEEWTMAAEVKAMREFGRYSDGRHVAVGDEVSIPGEPGLVTYRVVARDPEREVAVVVDAGGRSHRLPFRALALVSRRGGGR